MSLRLAALIAAIMPIAAMSASAQLSPPPPTYAVFAGVASPTGDSDRFNNGRTIGAAIDFYAIPNSAPVGVRLEGSYTKFDARTSSTAATSAAATELAVNVNAVLWAPPEQQSSFSPYLAFGPTYSRVHESVRSGADLLSETTNNYFLGLNAGGGFDVAIGAFAVRLDARYRRSMNSTFQSFPLTVGIRF